MFAAAYKQTPGLISVIFKFANGSPTKKGNKQYDTWKWMKSCDDLFKIIYHLLEVSQIELIPPTVHSHIQLKLDI